MFVTDTDQNNAYVNDYAFDYDHLPSARYANGDLIEPTSPDAPTVLYVHQAVYDKHRVTFFIKSDGTVRLASRNINGKGVTYQQLNTDGSFAIVQKQDTQNPEETSQKFSQMAIEANGNILLQTPDHKFEITPDGLMYDGKPLFSFTGGDSVIGDIQQGLSDVQTSITVINGKIETTVSQTTYDQGIADAKAYADQLNQGVQTDINNTNTDVTNLQTYVDGSFKDGVITQAESNSIQKYLNTLAKDKADLDAKYTEISTNTYLDATNKTTLDNAKTAYDNQYQALLNTINLSIADNVVTDEEKTAVDTGFANYSSAVSTLSSAFQTAINAIATAKAQEAETNAKGYTDGQITTVNSSITQLADEIDLKVDSTTYTTDIQNINSTQATLQTTVDNHTTDITNLQTTQTNQQQTIDNTIQNIPYRIQLLSTNGLVFKNGDISTQIIATVYHGNDDVTSTIAAADFVWSRISDDAAGDAAWNNAHVGVGNKITVTTSDVYQRATFECDLNM
jgi:hypothetical protein